MLTAAHEHFFRRDQLTPHASHGQWFIHKTIVSNVSGVDLPFPSDCDEEWSCTVHNVDHRASKVPSTTVDAFVASRNIKWVDVLKIDAEGTQQVVDCFGVGIICAGMPPLKEGNFLHNIHTAHNTHTKSYRF